MVVLLQLMMKINSRILILEILYQHKQSVLSLKMGKLLKTYTKLLPLMKLFSLLVILKLRLNKLSGQLVELWLLFLLLLLFVAQFHSTKERELLLRLVEHPTMSEEVPLNSEHLLEKLEESQLLKMNKLSQWLTKKLIRLPLMALPTKMKRSSSRIWSTIKKVKRKEDSKNWNNSLQTTAPCSITRSSHKNEIFNNSIWFQLQNKFE